MIKNWLYTGPKIKWQYIIVLWFAWSYHYRDDRQRI